MLLKQIFPEEIQKTKVLTHQREQITFQSQKGLSNCKAIDEQA
jgi:hypothetical protein